MKTVVNDQTEMVRFANWLKKVINNSDFNKKTLADNSGVSASSIYRLCAAKLPLPNERTIRKIEAAIDESYERDLNRHLEIMKQELTNVAKKINGVCELCNLEKAKTTYKGTIHCLSCKQIALSVSKLTEKQKLRVIKENYKTQTKMAEVLKTSTSALSRFFSDDAIPNREFTNCVFAECLQIYQRMGTNWATYNRKFAQERLENNGESLVDTLVSQYGYPRPHCVLQDTVNIEIVKNRPFKFLVDCKIINDKKKLMLVIYRLPAKNDEVVLDSIIKALGTISLTGARFAAVLLGEKIIIIRFNNDRTYTEIQAFPDYCELNE